MKMGLMETTTKARAPRGATKKKETFELFAPEAESVELVGDFTNWEDNPVALKRSKDGTWKATVSLDSGTYEYRFKVDGEWQNDPDCQQRHTNPFGQENCVREVQ
jgi:1,4-alpha-glucan branching enzyme